MSLTNILRSIKNSVTLKLLGIFFLVLILLLPLQRIQHIVDERDYLQQEAQAEIASKWATDQTLTGPVLSIPYGIPDTSGQIVRSGIYHILPDSLNYHINCQSKERRRGLYKAILYTSTVDIEAVFPKDILSEVEPNAEFYLNKATTSFGLTDLRGIQNQAMLKSGEQSMEMKPGPGSGEVFASGFHYNTPFELSKPLSLSLTLEINGSNNLYVSPLGKETNINMQADWPHPKFMGAFLPDTHHITSDGFTANWSVMSINRSFSQRWYNNQQYVTNHNLGVELNQMVQHYQKTLRAIKYAFLVLSLTFMVFFFFELMKNYRVHPVQYVIVGFALLVFYTLLLAISEHLSFALAYLISAASVTSIITLYFYFLKRSAAHAFLFFTIKAGLFSFLFVLLTMEEFSLLAGAIGLFLITAVIMFITRNVNWYNLKKE